MKYPITSIIRKVIWAALLGYIGAWVAWMYIYGIGSRVIQDQEHYAYANAIHIAGTIIGVLCGILTMVISKRPYLAPFLIHFLAGLAFLVLPFHAWQAGIRNYFSAILVFTALITWLMRRRNETGGQQGGPGYPPQSVGSPDP